MLVIVESSCKQFSYIAACKNNLKHCYKQIILRVSDIQELNNIVLGLHVYRYCTMHEIVNSQVSCHFHTSVPCWSRIQLTLVCGIALNAGDNNRVSMAWFNIRDILVMTALLEYFDYQFKFTLVDKKWSLYLEILGLGLLQQVDEVAIKNLP